MKISIQTAELTKALYRVQGIADRKSTMPVLAHVLLMANENHELVISATDSEMALSGTYKAEVIKTGGVAVQARQLYDIVKSISAPTVELTGQENHWVDIRGGSTRFHVVGMSADEFPELPTHTDVKTFAVPKEKLASMVDRTLFCVSTDENRHHLSGIFCETPKPHVWRMVSTDGHRLALAEGQLDADLILAKGVIVPRKAFTELKRVMSDTEGDTVQLGFGTNAAVIGLGSTLLSTRLIEGQFPDYQQVIPKGGDKKAIIARGPFADALRRVSLLSQGRAHGVRFEFKENTLTLIAEDPELGDAQEMLDVEYAGSPLVIGFNARYILDVLALMTQTHVSFDLADDLCPGILRPKDDKGFLAVVMPMRF